MIPLAYLRWRNALPDLRGMPAEDAWFAFRDAHHGRCALCREDRGRLYIDHDHTTGLVRGLLCRGCNRLTPSSMVHAPLNAFTSAPDVVLYCQWPPADVCGIRERYFSPFCRDPSELVYEVLWHAGPDGVEHERVRRLDRMQAVMDKLSMVLYDPTEEAELASHAHLVVGELQLLLERMDRLEYVRGRDARPHIESCQDALRALVCTAVKSTDDPGIMSEILGHETARRYTLPTDADRRAAIELTADL